MLSIFLVILQSTFGGRVWLIWQVPQVNFSMSRQDTEAFGGRGVSFAGATFVADANSWRAPNRHARCTGLRNQAFQWARCLGSGVGVKRHAVRHMIRRDSDGWTPWLLDVPVREICSIPSLRGSHPVDEAGLRNHVVLLLDSGLLWFS